MPEVRASYPCVARPTLSALLVACYLAAMRKVASKPKARAVKPKEPRRARPTGTEEEEDRLLAKLARKALVDPANRKRIGWEKLKKRLGL